MKIVLAGSKVIVVGRFRGFKLDSLRETLALHGAEVVKAMSAEVDFMIAGVGYPAQLAEARNMGLPILDEAQLMALLATGFVAWGGDDEPEDLFPVGERFGELRALFQEYRTPTPWLWQLVTHHLDSAPEGELDAMVAYVKSFMDRWAAERAMTHQWGSATELFDPEEDGRALDSSWENGLQGELRVAPTRWVGELYQGVESPKFSLIHGLELGASNLSSKSVAKILAHPQLEQLEHLVTAMGNAPTRKFLELLCSPPLLHQLKSLRVTALGKNFESWLVELGTAQGALRALDVSQYHASITWECLDAPYLQNLDTFGMWEDHFRVFMRRPITQEVRHLSLHGVSFKHLAKALERPWFCEHLKTVRMANYHAADWKTFFEFDFAGQLDVLDIGQPVPYQRGNMIRYGHKALQKLLLTSPLIRRVSTLKLGAWRPYMDEEAILATHPHLTLLS